MEIQKITHRPDSPAETEAVAQPAKATLAGKVAEAAPLVMDGPPPEPADIPHVGMEVQLQGQMVKGFLGERLDHPPQAGGTAGTASTPLPHESRPGTGGMSFSGTGKGGAIATGDKTAGDKSAGTGLEGGWAGAASGGVAGKLAEDGYKGQGDKSAGGTAMGDNGGGWAGELDKFGFGKGSEDFAGDKMTGEKGGGLGDKAEGFGDKLAGMGEGSPEGGKFGKGATGSGDTGYGDGWKKDGSYADGWGKKDGKSGIGGKDGKTGGVDSGKKDKTDSTKDTGKDDKKTDSSDSGKKTESKTSEKADSGKAKETDSKEKEKKDAKGVGGGGPGDPTGFDDTGNADPMGFRPHDEKNPMPTGEEVGIQHGEGDRGHSNRFSVQGSIHARTQPGGGQDGEYAIRAEGPSLLWELQHYGIDRPETGAVEGMTMGAAGAATAASDGQSGATGQVAGTVRADARAGDLVEEPPAGGQIPPGAGD